MGNKNKYRIALLLAFCLIIGGASSAEAKSLYVNKDLNANSPISAYDIQPANLVYQMTSVPTRYGGAGLGIDTDSKTLFVTFEGSGRFDIVDAVTLAKLGQVTAPGANNLAGIVVDQDKQKVYTNNRGSNYIFIYSWNAATKTLTLDKTQTLPGAVSIYGIALDEVNDLLYVGDLTSTVKVYKTSDWSSAGTLPLASGQKVMGIAVDVSNGYVYTGNAYPPFGGLGLLSRYDLGTNTETTLNVRTLSGGSSTDNVVGLAVDQDTGMLYITTGNQASGGSDRIIGFDSSMAMKHATGAIGNPTGICVPIKDISYNPLSLAKTDGVSTVVQGGTLTYTISYTNTNPTPVTGVTITDTLPSGVTWVSGGTHAAGVVTWNIGGLTAGQSGSVTVTVTVGSSTPIDTVLDNAATIDSDNTPPTTQHDTTKVVSKDTEIPEFPTIALPIAAIIGLAFIFQRRKD